MGNPKPDHPWRQKRYPQPKPYPKPCPGAAYVRVEVPTVMDPRLMPAPEEPQPQ